MVARCSSHTRVDERWGGVPSFRAVFGVWGCVCQPRHARPGASGRREGTRDAPPRPSSGPERSPTGRSPGVCAPSRATVHAAAAPRRPRQWLTHLYRDMKGLGSGARVRAVRQGHKPFSVVVTRCSTGPGTAVAEAARGIRVRQRAGNGSAHTRGSVDALCLARLFSRGPGRVVR